MCAKPQPRRRRAERCVTLATAHECYKEQLVIFPRCKKHFLTGNTYVSISRNDQARAVEDIGDNKKGSQAVPGLLLANSSNMSEEPKQERRDPGEGVGDRARTKTVKDRSLTSS